MDDDLDAPTRALLVEQVRRALVHELGARQVDVWLGKDGLHQWSTDELAAIAVDALAPVLAMTGLDLHVAALHGAGTVAPPIAADPNDW